MEFTITGSYTEKSIQRIFDKENPVWHNDKELSRYFLEVTHNWLKDMVELRGWVTLNEVYALLGFPNTPEGAVIGWDEIPDKRDKNGLLFTFAQVGENLRFKESRWVIDFFVDGVIFCSIGVKETRGENYRGT